MIRRKLKCHFTSKFSIDIHYEQNLFSSHTRPSKNAELLKKAQKKDERRNNNYKQFWFSFRDKTSVEREKKCFGFQGKKNKEEKFSREKCVINENKIIDKKAQQEKLSIQEERRRGQGNFIH